MKFDVLELDSVESLNNYNFFTPAKKAFPRTVEHFQLWIKKYAERIMWDTLFGNSERIKQYGGEGNNDHLLVRFEHLPLELQFGIILSFLKAQNFTGVTLNTNDLLSTKSQIQMVIDAFSQLEQR